MKIKILKEAAEDTWEKNPVPQEDADATFQLEPREKTIPKTPMAYLRYLGFEDVDRLGGGAVGNVYKADYQGRELAIKIVPKGKINTDLGGGRMLRWSGEKEVRAYKAIKDAREKSKHIAKHFPLVYTIMGHEDQYYIVMERLTDEGPYAAVIDELFQGSEALVAPGKDLMMYGAWKDLSRRMFMYLKNKQSRNDMIDQLFENFSEEVTQKAKAWAVNWWKYVNNPKYTAPRSYEMIDELIINPKTQDNFLDEFGNLQREFEDNPWISFFILKLIEIAKENDLQTYYMSYIGMATGFVNIMRTHSPIGTMHKPSYMKKHKGGASDEMAGAYEEAKSLKKALTDLEKFTGMVGTDMHDKNVMMRPIDGAIVIVDVGLFRPRSEMKESGQGQQGNESDEEFYKRIYRVNDPEPERDEDGNIIDGNYKSNPHKGPYIKEKIGLEEVLYEIELDRSKLEIKNRLNPKFWDKKQLDSEVRKKLLEIARDFEDGSEIDGKVENITLTGGNASYNWHGKSDLDVHLVVDYKRFGDKAEYIKKIMDLERVRWNRDHNVLIHGHEVEIYVQDKDEDHYASGVFSLEGNRWIEIPSPTKVEYNYSAILKKAEAIEADIKIIERLYAEEEYEKVHKQAEKLKEKIRNMRSAGLEKDGLWSTENIAFKILRNSGYLDHLNDLYTNSYDNMNSLGGKSTITISILSDIDEKKKKKKKKRKKTKKKRKNKYHFGWGDWYYGGGYGDSGGDGGGGE